MNEEDESPICLPACQYLPGQSVSLTPLYQMKSRKLCWKWKSWNLVHIQTLQLTLDAFSKDWIYGFVWNSAVLGRLILFIEVWLLLIYHPFNFISSLIRGVAAVALKRQVPENAIASILYESILVCVFCLLIYHFI